MQIFVKDGLQGVARRMRQNQSPVIDQRVFLEKRSGLRLVVETSKSERDRHSSAQEFGIVKITLRATSRKRTQRACRGRPEGKLRTLVETLSSVGCTMLIFTPSRIHSYRTGPPPHTLTLITP